MDIAFYLVLLVIQSSCACLIHLKMKAKQVATPIRRRRIFFFSLIFWLLVVFLSLIAYYDQQGVFNHFGFALIMIPVVVLLLFSLKQVKNWME